MKINIQIEDATPEELRQLFAGEPTTPNDHALLPMPIFEKLLKEYPKKEKKKVPDPTFEEIKQEQDGEREPEVKAPKKNKKEPHNKHGHLQLPCRFSDDRKKYQAAWSLCRRFNFVPYPEALKLQEAKKAEQDTNPKKLVKPPVKRNSDAVRAATPAAVIHKKINDVVIKQNGPIRAGQFVKHNGTKSSPFFGQVGEVLKVADDGKLFVKFGSSTLWTAPHIVMVMSEATVS